MNLIIVSATLTAFLSFIGPIHLATPQPKAELTITISDCRDAQAFAYLPELIVLKNGIEFKTLKPEHETKQMLTNLELGTYTLKYSTLFKKKAEIIVKIDEPKRYAVTVCVDFMDYSKETYKPVIDRLAVGETLSLIISSQGCFHSTNDTVRVTRTRDFYVMKWDEKTKKLTASDIDAFRHFELELNYMNHGFCTTRDSYTISHNGKAATIVDGSCEWSGDLYLRRKIFGM